MNRRTLVGMLLAGGITAGMAASPKLQYCAYNLADELVQSQQVLSEEEQRKRELMKTGDEKLDELVEAFVQYVDADNRQHIETSWLKKRFLKAEAEDKKNKFFNLDSELNFGYVQSRTFQGHNDVWENAGFAYAGEVVANRVGSAVNNVYFGRIIGVPEFYRLSTGKQAKVVRFEPLVDSYKQAANLSYADSFVFNEKIYFNLEALRRQAKMLQQYYSAIIGKTNRSFEDNCAFNSYLFLSDNANREGTDFESAFIEMATRSLKIHEGTHLVDKNTKFPISEWKAYLTQIAEAEKPEEQFFYLQHLSNMYQPDFLTPELKSEFETADFKNKSKIAIREITKLKD